MAIFRPSSIVGNISGAIGGVTFVVGSRSAIVRHRPYRSPNHSPSLLAQQSAFANTTRSWVSLTEEQRQAWRALAANTPATNRLGQTSPQSGFVLFLKSALIYARWNSSPTTVPPTRDDPRVLLSMFLDAKEGDFFSNTITLVTGTDDCIVQMMGARSFSTAVPKFFHAWREFYLETHSIFASAKIDVWEPWKAVFGPLQASEAISVRVRILTPDQQVLPGPILQQSAIVQSP